MKKAVILLILMSPLVFQYQGSRTSAASPRQISDNPTSDIREVCGEGSSSGGNVDLVLLIDQSKSLDQQLNSQDVKSNKLQVLKSALAMARPLFERSNDRLRIAVITFADSARVVRNLDAAPFDEASYISFVNEVSKKENLGPGTNYLDAIDATVAQFGKYSPVENCRVVLWFTDGQVDLPSTKAPKDGERLLEDFCGSSNGAGNKAQLLKRLDITTFVVLLVKDEFKVEGKFEGEEFNRQASIIGLRGITGDWEDPNDSTLKAVEPCDDENNVGQGEVIQVTEVENLVNQLLVFIIQGTLPGNEYCPTKQKSIEDLPSGRYFNQLVIYTNDGQGLEEPEILKGRTLPIALYRSDPADAAILDQLDNGWNIRSNIGQAAEMCVGYELRKDLVFSANTMKEKVRVEASAETESDAKVKITISEDGVAPLNRSDFTGVLSRLEKIDVVSEDRTLELTVIAERQDKKLETFLGALELKIELTKDGRAILQKNPVLVTIRLSRPVAVVGNEDLPTISCGENVSDRYTISISSRDEEVRKSPYVGETVCRFENVGAEKGRIRIRFGDTKLEKIKDVGFAIVVNNQVDDAKESVEFDNSSELSETTFTIGTTESFPNEAINYLATGALEVVFDDGKEPYLIGQIDVVIELSLLPRSNLLWAIVFALIFSIAAILLAYTFLYAILKKTAVLGTQGSISVCTVDCSFEVDTAAGKTIRWVEKDTFALDPKEFENLQLTEMNWATAGTLELKARIASPRKPQQVVRQAWADVKTKSPRVSAVAVSPTSWFTYDAKDPLRSATKAPLGQMIVIELSPASLEGSTREARVTFFVRNRGESVGNQVAMLKSKVQATFKEALEKELKTVKGDVSSKSSASEEMRLTAETGRPLGDRPPR